MDAKSKTRKILQKYNLWANKRLGQNFLIDDKVLNKIVQAAEVKAEDVILEIGPGLGVLTEKLAQTDCQKVLAIELDKRLLPILADLKADYAKLEIVQADALQANIAELTQGKTFKVVANLPYYITTPLIMRFLESELNYERLVVMVQNEVAERMVSPPGSKTFGALSIAVQYRTDAQLAFTVPPGAFVPVPNVKSAVVVCRKRKTPPVTVRNEKLYFSIVKAAFTQRRKIISNSLKNMGLTSEQTQAWLKLAGINEQRRAETLSLKEFAQLEQTYDKW